LGEGKINIKKKQNKTGEEKKGKKGRKEWKNPEGKISDYPTNRAMARRGEGCFVKGGEKTKAPDRLSEGLRTSQKRKRID